MCRLRPNIVSVLEESRHRVSCVRLPRRTRLIFDTVLLHSRVPTAAREVLAGCVSGMCLLSMICKSGLWCSSSPLHNHTQPHTTTHNHTQPHTTTHNNTQQHATTRNNTPQHTTTHHNTPQHTTTHHNTPQHTATHRNTPQHTTWICTSQATDRDLETKK